MVKKPNVYVLDTSAVIAGFAPGLTEVKQFTVQAVLEEARSVCTKLKLETAVLAGRVEVAKPSADSVRAIRETIRKTGDVLSKTDAELLALALDLRGNAEPVILTDDYSIQNLANLLGIEYRRVLMPGITEIFEWEMVCPACGLKFPSNVSRCSVCGSPLKRKPRKMKRVER